MKTTTEQPGTDLAELHAKVIDLEEMAQAKKEELRRKQDEGEANAKKTEEEQRLKDLFEDGEKFAQWILKSMYGFYTIKILGVEHNCGNMHIYINCLETVFKKLQDHFEEKKKVIYDPEKEKKIVSVPPRCRVFPGSGTVINDCCGGVNGHERHCGYTNLQKFPMGADELEVLRKQQDEELGKLIKETVFSAKALHAHMEGFIETILKSNPDTDALLDVVRVAMIAGADIFHEFDGRRKVIERLNNVVIGEIENKLSSDENLDEAGIKEIQRILNEIRVAVGQQICVK